MLIDGLSQTFQREHCSDELIEITGEALEQDPENVVEQVIAAGEIFAEHLVQDKGDEGSQEDLVIMTDEV